MLCLRGFASLVQAYFLFEDDFKDNFFNLIVHFFCSSKRNEPKKKRPEMKNFVHTYARYTSLIGATVWPKFRAISGLPTRRRL